MDSDLGYWLVMLFLALVVIAATGGTVAYAYFSEDRWGRRREAGSPTQDEKTPDREEALTR